MPSPQARARCTRHLDLDETRGIAVAKYDDGPYPDLAVIDYYGDGSYQTVPRPGSGRDGLSDASREALRKYTVQLWSDHEPTPRNMPPSGLKERYPRSPSNRSSPPAA